METSPRLCSHIPCLIVGLKSAFPGGSIRFLSSEAESLARFLVQSLRKIDVNELLARFQGVWVISEKRSEIIQAIIRANIQDTRLVYINENGGFRPANSNEIPAVEQYLKQHGQ